MNRPNLKNPKLAEFIGVLLGDGSIGKYKCKAGERVKTQYRTKVTLSSREKEYLNYLDKIFQEIFGIEPIKRQKKNENVIEMLSYRKELFKFLTQEIGLKEAPKWNNAVIPKRYLKNNLEKDVLRGYFDTDGSLVLTDNNGTLYPRLEMKICPSPMQKQLISILERLGFRFGVYKIGKGKVRIQLNGKGQLNKWIKEVGFSNKKHTKKNKKV